MEKFLELSDLMHCTGDKCPLKMTCLKYLKWLSSDDNDEDDIILPDYHEGNCQNYEQKEFYGQ